ncbi:hypothetical protein [Brevibacterium sp.]|uniref:hypothetical protein n=1 Tax=Brevibacterium sp. TaxID=1701 RepID=UPI0025C2DB17|nr:hypothetical protein [Brevibacterium sp.]
MTHSAPTTDALTGRATFAPGPRETAAQEILDAATAALAEARDHVSALEGERADALSRRDELDRRIDAGELDDTAPELVEVVVLLESLDRRLGRARGRVEQAREEVEAQQLRVTYERAEDLAETVRSINLGGANSEFAEAAQQAYNALLRRRYELQDAEEELVRVAYQLRDARPEGTVLSVDGRQVSLGSGTITRADRRPGDTRDALALLRDPRAEAEAEARREEQRQYAEERRRERALDRQVNEEQLAYTAARPASEARAPFGGTRVQPQTHPSFLGSSYASLMGHQQPEQQAGSLRTSNA